ncbi:MAG: DUF1573 domain-containing protein [Planctomycetes bacterium]|nr:DUF1573 domain-containing protein [Planctomycetota bacterium]
MGVEQARYAVWVFGLGLLAGCGADPEAAVPGMLFDEPIQALGVLTSGEDRPVNFDFQVIGAPVKVDRIESSCGCIELELRNSMGEIVPWGQLIPAGTEGSLHAVWSTAGYLGERESTLRLLGEGPGLPTTLRFTGTLEPWFEIDPPVVRFDPGERDQEQVAEVIVRGPEPFAMTDILAGVAGLSVVGLPSEAEATEHRLRLVREADAAEEGLRTGFVQLRTSHKQGYRATIPVEFEISSVVWMRPAGRYLLGEVVDGQIRVPSIGLGAREGSLEIRKSEVLGLEGASVKVETQEDSRRFTLELLLPPGLASGPVRGTIQLLLAHRGAGRESLLQREIQFFGLAKSSSDSESQER